MKEASIKSMRFSTKPRKAHKQKKSWSAMTAVIAIAVFIVLGISLVAMHLTGAVL